MMRETLEWAPFRTKPGVTDGQLLAASEHLQKEFVSRQEGFLSRRLVRAPDGGYVDIVLWSSPETARQAMDNASRSDTCWVYFSLMEADAAEAGAGVLHFECLAEYAK